ncbi:MAG: pseudouridine synthase [Tissierellia bacterium]|nr:pseudouridine synthase [Tissierellia bacterium]
MKIRIDKVLSNMGYGARREIKRDFRRGGIVLNGKTIRSSKTTMDPETDELLFYGEEVIYRPLVYLVMNKPKDAICSNTGPKAIIPYLYDYAHYDLHTVGRLDRDTTGLLIMTNDGDYTHRIISPKSGIPKKYYVETQGKIFDDAISSFREGIHLLPEDIITEPAELEILGDREAYLTIFEGKYHQVKRMFEAVDNSVAELHRVQIGHFHLPDLDFGEYREMTKEELDQSLQL